ncbi:RadC family protein [Anaplasma capra]|uniref:RadC family protein n=1 Tax=Anaplasma capra TaxID=1562740 RepID=UPI0021D5D362|nr:DNA repair protein RadC [Anaplasma capra]MCU7611837.1 DNA repair protein RadC [Anaplasma capra]MCU7612569.1 DNA repair protein RadC [Anaplasma capra]
MRDDDSKCEQLRYGHRARLRERLLSGEGSGLLDYEILELILCSARNRVDLKPIAKRLIGEFGTLSGVIHADVAKLKRVDGVGESSVAAILCVREALVRTLKGEVKHGAVINEWHKLLDYLRVKIGNSSVENFYVLYLNKKYCVIADEIQNTGTVDETPLYVREVIKKSLFHGATCIVISHNHPSGDPKPSNADINITNKLQAACASVNIVLVDHVIVTPRKHYSFKTNGLL